MKDCKFKNLCFGKNRYLEIPITVVLKLSWKQAVRSERPADHQLRLLGLMSIQAQIWEQYLNGSFGAWIAWQAKEVNCEVLPLLFRSINWLLSWKFICWFCPCDCTTWPSLDQRKLFLERANKYLSCAPAFILAAGPRSFSSFETFKWVDASHFCIWRFLKSSLLWSETVGWQSLLG